MKVLSSAEMRQAEMASVEAGVSLETLMQNAGLAVARALAPDENARGQVVLVLAGPGNNGGDGLVAARHLHDWGAEVHVWLAASRDGADANLAQVADRGIPVLGPGVLPDETSLSTATVVLDALFGTGQVRPFTGLVKETLQMVARQRQARPSLRLVALDLPSGLNADTGQVDPATLAADLTVTLAYPKPGLYLMPGAASTGGVICVDIDIPPRLVAHAETDLITADTARGLLPVRPPQANKGSFGKALLLVGSPSYVGAASLAAAGTLRAGAGLVTLAVARSLQPALTAALAEATYLLLPEPGGDAPDAAAELIAEAAVGYDVLLAGCGLGQAAATATRLANLLLGGRALPLLVLDADALNILAQTPDWWRKLPPDGVLTPHPGEMSRLTGLTVAEIQADRINLARRYAAQWGQMLVLKGANTVVAAPGGAVAISPFANPGLATAGTGDVLAGVVAGLIAQGVKPYPAAVLGVYLHATAAAAVAADIGAVGMLAGDLLPALPRAIKKLAGVQNAAGS